MGRQVQDARPLDCFDRRLGGFLLGKCSGLGQIEQLADGAHFFARAG